MEKDNEAKIIERLDRLVDGMDRRMKMTIRIIVTVSLFVIAIGLWFVRNDLKKRGL